jgi:hypothetical protein
MNTQNYTVQLLSPAKRRLCWAAQIIAAVILAETLFYKFSGAAESIYIFNQLGAEPWGRYITGMIELIAAILILIPASCWVGALLTVSVMSGAILAHFTAIGISIRNDGGYLFALALITLLAALIVLFIRKEQSPFTGK